MIGTPRPKCHFCGGFEDGDTIKIPFDVERCDSGGEQVKLPKSLKPHVTLQFYYKYGMSVDNEARPYISSVVEMEDDGWLETLIEIRYCPYCGRDLWEAVNK
jgi:hypothetical protein